MSQAFRGHRHGPTIRIWGSPQMGDLLARYEAGFHRAHPNVRFVNDLYSTVTAVAGVYTSRADLGLLGREIWPSEVQAYTSVRHHAPRVIEIATGSYDVPKATFALMIFVPQANPIGSLSATQLAKIFGTASRASGASFHTWGELGLTGEWPDRPIHLYGFELENDKSQIFSKLVFAPGQRWNCDLREFNNSADEDAGAAIVRAVARDPDAIGISNVHYATQAVRAVPISVPAGIPISPSRATVAARTYPLIRAVYAVVDPDAALAPDNGTSAAVREFLHFMLSRMGAEAVREEGNYLPLPADIAAQQQRALEHR
jgi:phosphate transport system substrate-binding protein